MKIDICSDVHLEFGIYTPSNPSNSEVLVLAGDVVPIHLLRTSPEFVKYFEQCSELYEHVIYILGNHSYYNGNLDLEFDNAKKDLGHIKNLHILQNESITIGDVTFLCGTMWTDCNKEDPMTMLTLLQSMSDYRVIKKNGPDGGTLPLLPEDTVAEHKKFKKFLIKALMKMDHSAQTKCVVVTHHSPTFRSVPEEYRRDYYMNGGYASNMDEFILLRPYIKYWLHGHTHTPTEFKIGETTVINNARGYVKYDRGNDIDDPYFPKTIEI